jgi:hypothetical protein
LAIIYSRPVPPAVDPNLPPSAAVTQSRAFRIAEEDEIGMDSAMIIAQRALDVGREDSEDAEEDS